MTVKPFDVAGSRVKGNGAPGGHSKGSLGVPPTPQTLTLCKRKIVHFATLFKKNQA